MVRTFNKDNPSNSGFLNLPFNPDTTLQYDAFSGVDIQCFFFDADSVTEKLRLASAGMPADQYNAYREQILNAYKIRPFGGLQTITVSIASSIGPIRRLGEKEVVEYKSGARTVAGSMVFAMLNRDMFVEAMRERVNDSLNSRPWQTPNYLDEIPEFNILIQGGNEFGGIASGLLIGVKISNFGTTFSVDDLYTEATYSYVARHYIPFTNDWKNTLYDKVFGNIGDKVASMLGTEYVPVEHNGRVMNIRRELYDWFRQLPDTYKNKIKPMLQNIQDQMRQQRTQEGYKDYLKWQQNRDWSNHGLPR